MDNAQFYHHPHYSHPLPPPPPPFLLGHQPMASVSSPHVLISPPPTLRPANIPSTTYDMNEDYNNSAHPFNDNSNQSYSNNQPYNSSSATAYSSNNNTAFNGNNTQAFFYPTFPPTRQARRYKSIKKVVPMHNGKLILECPVPRQYLDQVPIRDNREFNTMRYTAVTCDPSEYVQKNYTLRQVYLKRETEIVICITMYNVGDRSHLIIIC